MILNLTYFHNYIYMYVYYIQNILYKPWTFDPTKSNQNFLSYVNIFIKLKICIRFVVY